MTEQNIAKKGIILNTVLIIATFVAFLVIKITNQFLLSSYGYYGYSGHYMEMYTIQRATLIGLVIISVATIILAVLLMTKSSSKNTGFILLIIGAIVAAILAMFGLVLGIVTWILCGVSINQFRKLQGESTFESNLDFGAVSELKKAAGNNTPAQAATVATSETVVEPESKPVKVEAEATPVDVAYEVKSEDEVDPSENKDA